MPIEAYENSLGKLEFFFSILFTNKLWGQSCFDLSVRVFYLEMSGIKPVFFDIGLSQYRTMKTTLHGSRDWSWNKALNCEKF